MKTLAALIILLSTVAVHAGSSDGGYGKPGVKTIGFSDSKENMPIIPAIPTPPEAPKPALKLDINKSLLDSFLKVSPLSKLVSSSDGGYGKGTTISLKVLEGTKSIQALGDLPSGEIVFAVIDQDQNEDGFVIAPEAIQLMQPSLGEALKQSIQNQGQNVIIN